MRYVHLGHSELEVSAIALGCGNFGGIGSSPALLGKGEDEATAFELMDQAWQAGINLFDTANSYGLGASETIIGRWSAKRDVGDALLVSTKLCNWAGGDATDRGLSRKQILEQIDGSLARLGRTHLDLYMPHAPDPETPLEETMGAFDELVRLGKVRYLALSNYSAEQIAQVLAVCQEGGFSQPIVIQDSYSLIDRSVEQQALPLCESHGMTLSPFSPLCGGLLTGKYTPAEPPPVSSRYDLHTASFEAFWTKQNFAIVERLRQAALERDVPMASLALAWVLGNPSVAAPVIGPRRPAHLDQAIAALEIQLTQAQRAELAAPKVR